MEILNKGLIAFIVSGILASSSVALAGNADDKSFEGVIVEDVIVMEAFPTEVQSGSVALDEDTGYSDKAMAKLARISSVDAAEIAARAMPGDVVETLLENENGYLVWKVETVSFGRPEVEFMIDAGNGRLLAVENEEEDEGENWNWKFWESNDKDEH